MKIIHKYTLDLLKFNKVVVNIPSDSEILSVQMQNNEIVMWVRFHEDSERISRTFVAVCTGEPHPATSTYIGTVQATETLVLHIMEL